MGKCLALFRAQSGLNVNNDPCKKEARVRFRSGCDDRTEAGPV